MSDGESGYQARYRARQANIQEHCAEVESLREQLETLKAELAEYRAFGIPYTSIEQARELAKEDDPGASWNDLGFRLQQIVDLLSVEDKP